MKDKINKNHIFNSNTPKFFDNHYDLLTICQFMFNEKNNYYNPKKLFQICKIYRKDNIIGSIINLFFMSYEEMKNELDIDINKIDLVNLFTEMVDIIDYLKTNQIIESSTKFLYSIEGCDYLKNLDDLEKLYNKGLRSILPVWNNKNKYGSGNRTDCDLTESGKELIIKAVKLGIIVDISHANEKTFHSIIKLIKELILEGYKPIVIASHSNCKAICNCSRNLSNEQIKSLMEVDGYLGLFSNIVFVSSKNKVVSVKKRKMNFLHMIDYVITELNFPIDKLILSTDDMEYYPNNKHQNKGTFNLNNIAIKTQKLLLKKYDKNIVDKIMYKNSLEIFNSVNNYDKTNDKNMI